MRPGRPVWPGDARCAVMLTFDNFGEAYDLARFGHASGATADGVYAPRRGVERVLDLLEQHQVPATFFVEGWSARKYAPLLGEVVQKGHEVGAHGWMHEEWGQLDPKTEFDLITRTTVTLSDLLGRAPRGWRSPGGLTTPHTLRLLSEAGYTYDSSFGDDDIPYLLQVSPDSATEIIELPWTWPLNDHLYYGHPGTMRRPSEVIQLWIEEFDAVLALTGCFMLVCHPRHAGRPARLQALDQLIQHIKGHDGVWFARCEEVAGATRSWSEAPHYPAPEVITADDDA